MYKIIITTLLMVSLSFLAACETTSSLQKSTVSTQEPDLIQAAELNTQLAVGYIQRKQYKPARDKLEKAIEQNPNYLPAYKTLAYLYAVLGLTDKAEEKYQQALDLKPLDADLSNSYGAFLCTQRKYDEAQKSFKVAYSDPFYESAYLAESNAGSCYVEQGNYELGEAFLRKSLRKDPKLAGSLISMADIGIKTERYMMARAYIERYNAVKAPTAGSLWIQVLAEKNLGSQEYYIKYARQILEDFPDSEQAGWVEALARSDRVR